VTKPNANGENSTWRVLSLLIQKDPGSNELGLLFGISVILAYLHFQLWIHEAN